MKKQTRLIACILEIVIGLVLVIGYSTNLVDEFWSGMGSALLVVGIVMLIRQIRYKTNQTYREKVDVEVNDERNKFLSMKAWAWAGYCFVIIAAVATIVLQIVGQDELVSMAAGNVCLIMVLYWLSYMIIRRKY